MSLRINNNLASIAAQKSLTRTTRDLTQNYARLSSGLRITRAADDAAGLGVSESLRADITSAKVAMRNTNDGISLVNVAEGSMGEVHNMLNRMRELAMQSASEVLSDTERAYLEDEFDELQAEITRVAGDTEFNGIALTDGTNATLDVQVGFDSGDEISLTMADMSALGVLGTVGVDSAANAQSALATIDTDIETVSGARATLGAQQNRLVSTFSNLQNYMENLTAAESRIRDVDFASETAELTKNQILQQSGVSVLSQANFAPQAALTLLG